MSKRRHTVSMEDFTSSNWEFVIAVASGPDANGNLKKLNYVTYPADPTKSHYTIHDARDTITKYDDLEAAIYIYNII